MVKIKIHKQFTKCFSKFDNATQGLILKTIIEIRDNSTNAGLRLHKVGEYFSYSVNMNIRILSTFSNDDILLVYVGNHDETYNWGAKNKPLVANDSIVGFVDSSTISKINSFNVENSRYTYLRKYGFDNSFISFIDNLDDDALLNFLTFVSPEYQELILYGENDASILNGVSDVVVVNNDEELKRALSYSYDAWKIYLHPKQRYIVDYPNWKNIMIKGGPGTGKTVSLVHKFIKEYKTNNLHPLFLSYNKTTLSIVKNMVNSIIKVEDECFVVVDDFKGDTNANKLNEFLNSKSHIFIDEGQDLSIYFVSRLLQLFENGTINTPITIALDLNQSIFSSIGEGIKRLEDYFDIINLDYCYRSTKQIIQKANKYLDDSNRMVQSKNFQEQHDIEMSIDDRTKKIFCPLNGDEVVSQFCGMKDLKNVIDNFLLKESISSNDNSFAIIVDKQTEEIVKALGLKQTIYIADQVKGLEFFKGIVVTSKQVSNIRTAKQYRELALKNYVSLTRFRDKLFHIILEDIYDS